MLSSAALLSLTKARPTLQRTGQRTGLATQFSLSSADFWLDLAQSEAEKRTLASKLSDGKFEIKNLEAVSKNAK